VDLREVRWEGVGWIHLALERFQWWAAVNILKNLWVLLNARNLLSSSSIISFLTRTLLHGVSFSTASCIVSSDRMIVKDELDYMWKEAIMAYLKVLS